jgi:hypothetical protein
MYEITELENEVIDQGEGEQPIVIKRWKKNLLGQVQLHCPLCSHWFVLGRDFSIADDGLVSDVVYHVCDDDSESDAGASGWVVLPKLIGWKD